MFIYSTELNKTFFIDSPDPVSRNDTNSLDGVPMLILKKCKKKIGELLLISKNNDNKITDNTIVILSVDLNQIIIVKSKEKSVIKSIKLKNLLKVTDSITTSTKDFPIKNCFQIIFINEIDRAALNICARNEKEKTAWISKINELKLCLKQNNKGELKLLKHNKESQLASDSKIKYKFRI